MSGVGLNTAARPRGESRRRREDPGDAGALRHGHRLTRTLYVRAAGPRLPVAEVTREGGNRGSVTFSNWNHRVSVSAPTGATLIG